VWDTHTPKISLVQASRTNSCHFVSNSFPQIYSLVVGFLPDGASFEVQCDSIPPVCVLCVFFIFFFFFQVRDPKRLEAEVLPKYFRHSRFQSLVRQLNFYNFKKLSKERHAWVYYHKLFHRDQPVSFILKLNQTTTTTLVLYHHL
jgi:hypothetical protein